MNFDLTNDLGLSLNLCYKLWISSHQLRRKRVCVCVEGERERNLAINGVSEHVC